MIQKFLDTVNSRQVRFAGMLISLGFGAWVLHGAHRIAYLVCIALAALFWMFGKVLFNFNVFINFADPKYWPTFVMIGTAICIAAHAFGGWWAVLTMIGPLTVLDGIYFFQNY